MTRDEKSKDPVETSYVGTGLAIGLAIGVGLDKRAKAQGMALSHDENDSL